MTSKTLKDIIIIGGGITGSSLACALGNLGMRVAVIDKKHIKDRTSRVFDGRATAVAQSNKQMFSIIGVWKHLENKVAPIQEIRVADGHSPRHLHFDSQDVNSEALGYMVENRILNKAVLNSCFNNRNITYISPATILNIHRQRERVLVQLTDGTKMESPILVGADGRNSFVRRFAKIPVKGWPYDQTSLVCTISHEKPHYNVAHEHFFPSGPLAILPLPGKRSSIVWTENATDGENFMALDEQEFLLELTKKVGEFLGKLKLLGSRTSYPLSIQFAKTRISNRIALIGDAAHTIHPIAGQGLNLGLRDVAALAEILTDAHRLGLDLGSNYVLRRYEKWRSFDTVAMLAATDGLNTLFSNHITPIKFLRSVGLAAVNNNIHMKRLFMKQAMGFTGHLPKLLKGATL
ncbi:MAG: 2-octaprenyl-6-methoxyphenyl hydroxylase [Pseudomonadota bacterium]|nr:2-octaprenyl-6-methoxyphenyl hydroxylase [Pseudomonadota bacterium]